jgi:hypothetical protein
MYNTFTYNQAPYDALASVVYVIATSPIFLSTLNQIIRLSNDGNGSIALEQNSDTISI